MAEEFRLEGVAEFEAGVDRIMRDVDFAGRTASRDAAALVQRKAQELLGQKSHAAGTPTPSAPGEPPALITGNLRRSMRASAPKRVGFGAWQAQVGPTAVYGRIQELGGVAGRGHTLPARPYLQPALEAAKPELPAIYARAWRQAAHRL